MTDRPTFTPECFTDVLNSERTTLTSTDGREWLRIVLGTDGVAAAESAEGQIEVWDMRALFDAVFRAHGQDRDHV